MIVGLALFAAIKQRMEKDVDEVGKVARSIKSKIEELDREVRARTASGYSGVVQHLPNTLWFFFLLFDPEFSQQAEAWMWKRIRCRPIENSDDSVTFFFLTSIPMIIICTIKLFGRGKLKFMIFKCYSYHPSILFDIRIECWLSLVPM